MPKTDRRSTNQQSDASPTPEGKPTPTAASDANISSSPPTIAPTDAAGNAIPDAGAGVGHPEPERHPTAMAHPEHTLGAPRERRYEQHELSKLFPRMDPGEFQQLVESIFVDGLLDDITLCEGKIIDGFHRDEACYITGVPPRYVTLDPKKNKVKFVVDKNMRRRHLTVSQTGILMAKISDMDDGGSRVGAGRKKADEVSEKNQRVNLPSDSFVGNSQPDSSATDADVLTGDVDEPLVETHVPTGATGVSIADAARLGGVSRSTVVIAKRLLSGGNERLVDAVMQHGMSNGYALALAKLPVDDQIQSIHDFIEGKQEGEKRRKRKVTEGKAVEKSKKENAGIDVTCVVPGETSLLTVARVINGLDWAIDYFKVAVPNEGLQRRYDKLLARARTLVDNDPNVEKIRLIF